MKKDTKAKTLVGVERERERESLLFNKHAIKACSKEHGITLVVLVITIIVLLILSGVTITSIVGNGGLMSKAQDISTSAKRIQIVSQLKTDILTEQLDGDITKGQLEEILTEYGEVQYDDNGDITGVYVDDIDDIIDIDEVFTGTLVEEITDTTAPVATIELSSTSTSIGAAVTATVAHIDSESGVDITSCKYIYNSSSGKLGTTSTSWDTAAGFSSNPQTLSLSASAMGTYYLHVLTADLAGNIAEVVSDAITVSDASAPTVEIGLSSTSTTAGTAITATVTHTDNDSGVDITNCKYIYNTTSSAIGTTSTSWTSASSFSSNPQTLTLSTSTVGTYYLHVLTVDLAGNTAEVISSAVSVTDTTAPTITITPSSTSATTTTSITAKVTHTDSQSGVNITSCKYIYNTTSGTLGTSSTSWTSASSFSSNPQTLTLKVTTAGTYYLHVLSIDNAGNKSEKTSSAITVTETLVADGSFSTTKGVNTPKLGTGMTPIKWDGSSWVETTADDSDWYSYTTTDKKWANAKTSDGSMWVWIPRFAYQISSNYHTGGEGVSGTINIKFMKGTTNTAADGTTSWSNSSGQGNWNIHPAFTYSSTVAGIWVAKFEASRSDASSSSIGSTTTIKIQPGVRSWRSTSINYMYTYCLNYNTTLNSHLMKNSEWGAVAYLAISSYGKNSEVWINPNSNYITGQSGSSKSAGATTGTYAYTNTTYGVNASTTGNIYGIYDMSGGAQEYVAAYVSNTYTADGGSRNTTTYGASLIAGASYTKDVYSMGTSDSYSANLTAAAGVYGDAVYETCSRGVNAGSWLYDSSDFPNGTSPFFVRGGVQEHANYAGTFSYQASSGSSNGALGFRPVLAVL